MSKQIRPNELSEIVTGLLVRPDLLDAFDGSSQVHEEFIEAIGQVVTDYCGGRVNCVHPADLPMDSAPCFIETPYLSIWPSHDLPSLEACVWAPYDPEGWKDEVPGAYDLAEAAPRSEAETAILRTRLQGLLVEAVRKQNEISRVEYIAGNGINVGVKHDLTTFEEGAAYIDALAEENMVYHFDDGAADCLGHLILADDQIEAIEHNVAQLREINWSSGGYDCLFHYALETTGCGSEPEELTATDANGQTIEIDNPVTMNRLTAEHGIPTGAELIVRDIGAAGANQETIELICEDPHDGSRLILSPDEVSLKLEDGLAVTPSPFKVIDSGEANRFHLEVSGLGTVHLNRTHEGLIVDVWDSTGENNLSTTALDESDFQIYSEVE